MRYQVDHIAVPGQKTGEAEFREYILDPVSVEPKRLRPAVIVCPGGGYWFCSDREAEPIVMQFLSMGCHSFCLYYSVAPENHFPVSLWEAAKAVALVRAHSEEWLVDPEQIYVCGFSAGGHLACSLGMFWNRGFVYEPLGLTAEQVKPNGMILGYPVITSGEFAHRGSFECLLRKEGQKLTVDAYFRQYVDALAGEAESAAKTAGAPCAGQQADTAAQGSAAVRLGCTEAESRTAMDEFVSLEKKASADSPRAFVWHTFEDGAVPVENSLFLVSALRSCGVNAELHIFPKGDHGLALANEETSVPEGRQLMPAVQEWIPLVRTWIEGWKPSRV